jgi:FAD/FMN-containing dehydrogenase
METESRGVDHLRGQVRGDVVLPGDDRYDQARRVWNGMIDRRPAAIVRCRGAADVIEAVRFAQAEHLPVSVRCGGHNVSGVSLCDGVVIDLSPMNNVRVDPERRVVRAGGGATLRSIRDAGTGLAVPVGVVSRTGIGSLHWRHGVSDLPGLSCDNLISADVVTPTAASSSPTSTTFRFAVGAARGGGNFSVVTRSVRIQVGPTSR